MYSENIVRISWSIIIAAESTLFDYFTVAQSQVINIIVHCYGKSLDITAFNEILGRKDLRREAQSFRQLVDWSYSSAIDAKEGGEVTNQASQPATTDYSATLSENKKDMPNSNTVNLLEALEMYGAISHPETVASLQNSTPQVNYNSAVGHAVKSNHDKTGELDQAYHKNNFSRGLNAEGRSPNSNSVNLMDAFAVRDADNLGVSSENSTTHQDGGSAIISTAEKDNAKIKVAHQGYHKDSAAKPTADDLKIPVVEKEVLLKNWTSICDQNFHQNALPDCQKIALVAIIDYVKRKGVAIGSDQEIYQWLYHTASNHQHYYSRATNFKHLANILMKQLINKKFEKPSGFNVWEQIIKQQIGCRSMLQKE